VNRNHPIIIRFPGQNHPISARPRLIARPESTDNRPIFRRQSSDAAAKIVRDRQVKHPNRPSPTIRSAANPVEFDGIGSIFRNDSQVFEMGTVLFLGVLERLNNPGFKTPEFEGIKNEAGRNSFYLSAKKWAEARETDAALRKILKELGV
jgi:hypothetical protein